MNSKTKTKIKYFRPQPGPQTDFLSSGADIVFYGGSAGGGKTFGVLLEAVRYIQSVKGFGVTIFRRLTTHITKEGGLWDESQNIYSYIQGARPRVGRLDWIFAPHGNRISFEHLQHEDTVFNFQGAQIALIIFEELTHFTRKQFFYMLSRNRSTCGVKPYVRCTYNPVPDDDPVGGWIHEFVAWYIDEEGYPIPERSGVVRWFVNISDTLHWYTNKKEAQEAHPNIPPKSFTYIKSNVYDNKILLDSNPEYLANLYALGEVDQARLLDGNHKIRPGAGKVLNKEWFAICNPEDVPNDLIEVRFWDLAATAKSAQRNDPDFTAGCRMGYSPSLKRYYVLAAVAQQIGPSATDDLMLETAGADGTAVAIRSEQEPGASGKRDVKNIAILLIGYNYEGVVSRGDKITRGRGFSAASKNGLVWLVRGGWNERWKKHMHNIGEPGVHDDEFDAAVGAFNYLVEFTHTGGAPTRKKAHDPLED